MMKNGCNILFFGLIAFILLNVNTVESKETKYLDYPQSSQRIGADIYDKNEQTFANIIDTLNKKHRKNPFIITHLRVVGDSVSYTERESQHPLSTGLSTPEYVVTLSYFSPEFYAESFEDINYLFKERHSWLSVYGLTSYYYNICNPKEDQDFFSAIFTFGHFISIGYTNMNLREDQYQKKLKKNWYLDIANCRDASNDYLVMNNDYPASYFIEDLEEWNTLQQELSATSDSNIRKLFLDNKESFQNLVDVLLQKRETRNFGYYYRPFPELKRRILYFTLKPQLEQIPSVEYLIAGAQDIEQFITTHHENGTFSSIADRAQITYKCIIDKENNPTDPIIYKYAQQPQSILVDAEDSSMDIPLNDIVDKENENNPTDPIVYKYAQPQSKLVDIEDSSMDIPLNDIVNKESEKNPTYHINFKFAQPQSILVDIEYSSTDIPLNDKDLSYIKLAPNWYYKISKYREATAFWT